RRPVWLPAPPGVLPPPRADVPILAVAHGTGDPRGLATLEALLDRVRFLRPGVETSLSFVSVARPRVDEQLARLLTEGRTQVVVLPLLLGSGYHVRRDIPKAISAATKLPGCGGARIYPATPLGPDPLLASALRDRLAAMSGGTAFGTQVVLAAAGSSDKQSNGDAVAMAGLLAERLGMPVRTGFVTTAEPDISGLLTRLARRGRPIAVATYLLSSGEFSRRIQESATLAALETDHPCRICVTEPIGVHEQVARLVLRRYDAALAAPPLD
ncbi:MAG: sirohydrochlorin chelatase, partial [Actinocrinis sp.]